MGFFCLIICILGSSMSFNGSIAHFFLALKKKVHCLAVPWLIYPLTYWRTPWLFPGLSNYELSCYKHLHAGRFCGHKFLTNLNNTKELMAGSYNKSIFRFVRKFQTVFQSGCTILHSYQQWMSVPIAPHPRQHLML